jgi:hypothetical protein
MAVDHRLSPEHAAAIEAMKSQLLIVFVKRLGGTIDIPVSEVDDTAGDLLAFAVDLDKKIFHFEVVKK